MRKFLVGFLVIAILAAGIIVGLVLVNQQQIFNQKAAVPTGQATVSIQPAQASFQRNAAYPISVYFNTAGIPVSGISIRLTFSNLSVTASGIQIAQDLLSSGDWSCPVKTISSQGSTAQVDMSCVNTSTTGYSSQANTLLATFNLTATQVPVVNPLIVSFDATQSIITKKADGQDTLLTPTSTGSYTITDTIAASPTAPPIIIFASPTATPLGTVSPTVKPSATPLATSSATPLAGATNPPVPVTGFDAPTIILGGLGGALLLISTLAFIF